MGYGVSACATCDGFFFKDKKVLVVGGGDSAIEEATFLTKFASSVTILHRRDELRASKIMQDRAIANPKIDFAWNTSVLEMIGDPNTTGLTSAIVKDTVTGEKREIKCDGLFLGIGHIQNSELFKGVLELDETGYIITQSDSSKTNIEGVFAAGDIKDSVYRQAITAAGSGCIAAIDAEKYLETLH